ncbi:Uncharacterised protein [Legionella steigerwaltii]|uniref:Uncharacterized protein n=1 Tax=Legionella steigerwaltii TaxID=460 RepID=A0A378LDE5_9GAMM|nr:hypothetical protein [Legionella steigerwaltii]KTD76062.1 hypothetical protein Lstg_2350 [Legionella steigerwaltii]STY22121.1 Uncharacterised protein [Legionella steigerwaltii]
MPNPFFVFLKKKHTVPKVTSYKDTEQTKELQLLVASGNKAQYRKREKDFNEEGFKFRLTKGVVYEIRDEGEEIEVQVAVQVKGFTLTWYFWVPDGLDQYPQEFRDKLFNAAAKVQREKVDGGCDLYLRGSDELHGKLMHHLATEFWQNHNHYRLKDNKSYTPKEFNQHMRGLATTEIYQEFFEEGEIEKLCEEFAEFYKKWVAKKGSELSLEEQYFSAPSQKLDLEDVIELELFAHQQEPCRINMSELKVDYEAARKEIERIVREGLTTESLSALLEKVDREYNELVEFRTTGGSRGLTPEITEVSQVKGTRYQVKSVGVGRDDKLKKELPDVPKWAHSVQAAVEKAKAFILEDARKRLAVPEKGKVDTPSLSAVDASVEKVEKSRAVPTVPTEPKPKVEQLTFSGVDTFLVVLQKENENAKQVKNEASTVLKV